DEKAVDQMSAVMGRRGAIGGITTGLKTLDKSRGWSASWRVLCERRTPGNGQEWSHAVLCSKNCCSDARVEGACIRATGWAATVTREQARGPRCPHLSPKRPNARV